MTAEAASALVQIWPVGMVTKPVQATPDVALFNSQKLRSLFGAFGDVQGTILLTDVAGHSFVQAEAAEHSHGQYGYDNEQ